MTTMQSIEELIDLLARGTRDHSLHWQATADENAFRLTSATGNIRIIRSEEFDQQAMNSYVSRALCILNDKGRVIEEYSPTGATDSENFDELFTLARRSAYKTDEILDKLMDEIRQKVQKSQ